MPFIRYGSEGRLCAGLLQISLSLTSLILAFSRFSSRASWLAWSMIVRPFWAKAPPLRLGGGTGNADRDHADIGGLERERWPTSSVALAEKSRQAGGGRKMAQAQEIKKVGGQSRQPGGRTERVRQDWFMRFLCHGPAASDKRGVRRDAGVRLRDSSGWGVVTLGGDKVFSQYCQQSAADLTSCGRRSIHHKHSFSGPQRESKA